LIKALNFSANIASLEPQGYNLTEDLREKERKPIHIRIIKEEDSSGFSA